MEEAIEVNRWIYSQRIPEGVGDTGIRGLGWLPQTIPSTVYIPSFHLLIAPLLFPILIKCPLRLVLGSVGRERKRKNELFLQP